MANPVATLLRVPELRRKIWITLALLFVYRIGNQIPLPGLDLRAIEEAAAKWGGHGAGNIFSMINMFSGANLGQCTLFSLGVMPYISASIMFSLLVKTVPSLEALSKEGAAGQKKINRWTRYATVPVCLFQAFFVWKGVVANPDLRILPPENATFGLALTVVFALTAGTVFLLWIGEQISEHGVGNGVSLVIMAGIIDRLPSALFRYWSASQEKDAVYQTYLLLGAIWVLTVLVIVLITKGQRRVPIQQAKLTRGTRVYGGQRHYLPIKVNLAGVMPIIFASALFLVPSLFANLTGWRALEEVFRRSTGFIYLSLYVGMIFFFSFFWNTLFFQPNEIANNLKEYGSFIPGIRPGRRTAEYLEGVLVRVTLAGAAFLSAVAILPNFVTEEMTIGYDVTAFLGGTSVLIVVGVALDLVDKLNAQLLMRNYEGFLRGGGGWTRSRR
ncbi:MAG TPA: preprotein translocase subunit SecY [Planctomycetota bacterium]|jgi:preprotein translocase subunit SecY|nr:preprotein translocase subunit SecY [Planctomycetota bacterium]